MRTSFIREIFIMMIFIFCVNSHANEIHLPVAIWGKIGEYISLGEIKNFEQTCGELKKEIDLPARFKRMLNQEIRNRGVSLTGSKRIVFNLQIAKKVEYLSRPDIREILSKSNLTATSMEESQSIWNSQKNHFKIISGIQLSSILTFLLLETLQRILETNSGEIREARVFSLITSIVLLFPTLGNAIVTSLEYFFYSQKKEQYHQRLRLNKIKESLPETLQINYPENENPI